MENQKPIHVLMFPWLGYGHISPYLELAEELIVRNFTITFCSTSANFMSIKQKLIDENLIGKVHLLELELPSLPNVPPQHQSLHLVLDEMEESTKEMSETMRASGNEEIDVVVQELLKLCKRSSNIYGRLASMVKAFDGLC